MKKRLKSNYPIILILLLASALYIINLWKAGYGNLYYAAGVYSMGENLHAFFFNSLDSVGFVTIDKPPLGFWIQVLFTKVFGFSGMAILLPEAICGVFSVYLIYKIIGKRFGKAAGYVSAIVLALTPIFVAVSRNNTIDGILILMLVLATDQAIKAAEKSSMKHLILAGVFIGLGFNVKMLQAFMIVPAIYLTYLIFSKQKIVKRILSCVVSGIILIVISLSWVVAVDQIAVDSRPYIGSSDENSAVELVLGHNGISRILGRNSSLRKNTSQPNIQYGNLSPNQDGNLPPNQGYNLPPNQGSKLLPNQRGIRPNQGYNLPSNGGGTRPNQGYNLPPNDGGNLPPSDGGNLPPNQGGKLPLNQGGKLPLNQGGNNNNQAVGMQSPGGETGEASVFRLFNKNNAGQISWFLLPSMMIALASLYLIFRKKFRQDKRFIAYFFFALCIIPMFIYFSFAQGITHRYYFAMLAPPIAALIGIGFVWLQKSKKIFIPIVLVFCALVQLYIHNLYTPWLSILTWICAIVFVLTLIVMIVRIKKHKAKTLAYLLAVLMILPTIWALTPVIYSDNSQLPIAGPELVDQRDSFDRETDLTNIIEFLEENRDGATYLALAPSSMSIGSELILQSGEAVMVLGGFNGGDGIVSLEELQEMIDNGVVRYALLASSDNIKGGQNAEIYKWILENAKVVRPNIYGGIVTNVRVFKLG